MQFSDAEVYLLRKREKRKAVYYAADCVSLEEEGSFVIGMEFALLLPDVSSKRRLSPFAFKIESIICKIQLFGFLSLSKDKISII